MKGRYLEMALPSVSLGKRYRLAFGEDTTLVEGLFWAKPIAVTVLVTAHT